MDEPDWPFGEGEGYCADVEVGKHRLRLFSALSARTAGWAGYVYDLEAKRWIGKPEWADGPEDGKNKAASLATAIVGAGLPPLTWKRSPQKQL